MVNIKFKMGNKLANMSEPIKNLENTKHYIKKLIDKKPFIY
mgnify:CR=1 FL=1